MVAISNNPAGAAQAYAQAASRALDGASGASEAGGGATGGANFASMLQDAITSTVNTSQTAEKVSLGAISGKADVVDLVTAINNAEMTLQTVVAVRDKVVQAYQEIMRMPI